MPQYDESIADVIRTTIRDAQDLVRGEIALAKAELRDEVDRIGRGAAALAIAGVAGLIGVIFLLAALGLGIASAANWPAWTGFAAVGVLVVVSAAILASIGKKRLNGKRHMPLTVDTIKENMQWAQARKP